MKREIGTIEYPIWLLADSEPENWQNDLDGPLDPRHPARHSIWTSVLDIIQDEIYRSKRMRLDTSTIFIRNAIGNPHIKPKPQTSDWEKVVLDEIELFKVIVTKKKPSMIMSFGAFAFEFGRRALGHMPIKKYGYWSTHELGKEFRHRISNFNINEINLIPLLHTSISRGKFIKSHNYYCGENGANYFDFVGKILAKLILTNYGSFNIWL